MKHRIILIVLFLLIFTKVKTVEAQQIIPIYSAKSLQNNTLTINSDSGNLRITVYQADVIKITFNDDLKPQFDSVNTPKKPINIRVTQNLDDIFFATDSLWVIVSKFDLSIRFLKKQNEELLLKCNSYFLNNNPKLFSFTVNDDEKLSVGNSMKIKKHNTATDKCQLKIRSKKPMIISAKAYALYFNNATRQKLRLTVQDSSMNISGKQSIKSFIFLSGGLNGIEGKLKEL